MHTLSIVLRFTGGIVVIVSVFSGCLGITVGLLSEQPTPVGIVAILPYMLALVIGMGVGMCCFGMAYVINRTVDQTRMLTALAKLIKDGA